MSVAELAKYIGRVGYLRVTHNMGRKHPPQFTMDVRVLDARMVYGRYEFLVEPLAGAGAAWVKARYLTMK